MSNILNNRGDPVRDSMKHIGILSSLVLFITGTLLIILVLTTSISIDPVFGTSLNTAGIVFILVGTFLLYRILKSKDYTEVEPSDAIRIVAIDDEADIRRLIQIKLSKDGFEVITASDGIEGIKKVFMYKPEVVIVDVMMPGKDGYQVVSEIKSKLGDAAPAVIMLTAKSEDADMVKGLSSGADDYITKPFSPRELIERVNVVLIKRKQPAEHDFATSCYTR